MMVTRIFLRDFSFWFRRSVTEHLTRSRNLPPALQHFSAGFRNTVMPFDTFFSQP
jgi:hypothetical protein